MQKTTQQLEAELKKLREERAQQEASRQSVLESLTKAEARRAAERQEQAHWNRVIDHLEHSLDEVKARLARSDGEIARAERELKEAETGGAPTDKERSDAAASTPRAVRRPTAEAMDTFEHLLADLPTDPTQAARRILQMTPEELGTLNLEEVAILHGQIALDDGSAPLPDLDLNAEGVELVAHSHDDLGEEDEIQRQRQAMLRSAIGKIQANRLDELTDAEERIVAATSILLERRPAANPRDERLRRILGAAVRRLRARHKQGTPPKA